MTFGSTPMTFAAGTPGTVRNALVTTRDAINEELIGLLAAGDQLAYLSRLAEWCAQESARVAATIETAGESTAAAPA